MISIRCYYLVSNKSNNYNSKTIFSLAFEIDASNRQPTKVDLYNTPNNKTLFFTNLQMQIFYLLLASKPMNRCKIDCVYWVPYAVHVTGAQPTTHDIASQSHP